MVKLSDLPGELQRAGYVLELPDIKDAIHAWVKERPYENRTA